MSSQSFGAVVAVVGVVLGTCVNQAHAQQRISVGSMWLGQQMYQQQAMQQQALQQQYGQQVVMQRAMIEQQQKQAATDAAEEKRLHDKKVSASKTRAEKEKAKKDEIIAKRKADAAAKSAALLAPAPVTITDKSAAAKN